MAILVGDIAKNTSTLALFDHVMDDSSGEVRLVSMLSSKSFNTKEHSKSLCDLVSLFLNEHHHQGEPIYGACFGIGGPVTKIKNKIAEFSFQLTLEDDSVITIGSTDFQKVLPCHDVPVHFINDMEAIGYSIFLGDGEEKLKTIHEGKQGVDKRENRALMLVSSGLGQALWHCSDWEDGELKPIPSEGGHTNFAPRSLDEAQLLTGRLKEALHKLNSPISFENVLSSSGLFRIERLLANDDSKINDPNINFDDEVKRIIDEASNGSEVSKRALQLFVSLWGSRAGDIALTYLALGGIYIGGISIPIEVLRDGVFLDAFVDKERKKVLKEGEKDVFYNINKDIPIKVFEYENSILWGAARYAVHDGLVSQGKFAIMRANQ